VTTNIDDRHLLRTPFELPGRTLANRHRYTPANLDVAATNELVAHVLHTDIASTRDLTTVVHRQTLGNVFFVIQVLASLEERGFITYSSSVLRWTWDMDLVEPGTAQSVSATEILRGKINYLRDDLRALLKVASFMDATINVDLLAGIMQSLEVHNGARDIPPQDIQSLLDLACEEGLVDRVGRRQSGYKFKHDQVQQGAYSLIPEGAERARLHYRIGEILWRCTRPAIRTSRFFTLLWSN
jgi:predicted ATPase